MPENVVSMYIYQIYREEVAQIMSDILKTSGEEGIKGLKEDSPVRKLYLSIKAEERAADIAEHREVLAEYERLRNG